MQRTRWKDLALAVAALTLVAALFAPTDAADARRLVVSVDEPFEINGRLYPAGELTVKSVRTYNPAALLSEIWVGRECLGLFRASRVDDAGAVAGDSVTFARTAAGHLALVGFASRDSGDHGIYRFRLQARLADAGQDLARR